MKLYEYGWIVAEKFYDSPIYSKIGESFFMPISKIKKATAAKNATNINNIWVEYNGKSIFYIGDGDRRPHISYASHDEFMVVNYNKPILADVPLCFFMLMVKRKVDYKSAFDLVVETNPELKSNPLYKKYAKQDFSL